MTCQHCGGEIRRRPTESAKKYASRQFCSVSCASLARHVKPDGYQPPTCTVTGCGKPIKVQRHQLCGAHYEARRRAKGVAPRTVAMILIDDDGPRRPPVKCAICEAVRILARDGADARQTAAALHKPLPWIRAHLAECTKEKRTA